MGRERREKMFEEVLLYIPSPFSWEAPGKGGDRSFACAGRPFPSLWGESPRMAAPLHRERGRELDWPRERRTFSKAQAVLMVGVGKAMKRRANTPPSGCYKDDSPGLWTKNSAS